MLKHVDTLPHLSPQERCVCPVCDAARLAHLRALSPAQRRALAALDPVIPRHLEDLRLRGGQRRTLAGLMTGSRRFPALVQQLDLRRPLLDAPYYSFAILTRHGTDAVAARHRAGLSL